MRRLVALGLGALLVAAAVFWIVTAPRTLSPADLGPHNANLENGREMFFAGGCTSCHVRPGETDRTKLGGGLALHSPFGTFHVPNISPDPQDGVGRWSETQFVTAMLKGTSPDGRHYYPAFPYSSYQRMALADVRDLFAFIKTLPPVTGRAKDHDLPFPFGIRRLVGGWKFLFLDGRPFAPDSAQSAQWNRGAYLVNGPGHCAECHSPRNALGAIDEARRFAGGPNPEGEGWVPNITQKVLADYSADDFAYLLETGETPSDAVGGAMVPVIRNTSQLTPGSRAAMAAYLKSLLPVEGPPRPERKPK